MAHMRVLHIIARLNVGGTARYVGRLAQDLPQHGVEAIVATGYVQGMEAEDPIVRDLPVERIPHLGRQINVPDDKRARAEIRNVINALRPDILHTHTFKAGVLGRSFRLQIPTVHTFHGHLLDDPDFVGPKAAAITQVERALARRTSRIVTVGDKVSRDLLRKGVGRPDQYVPIVPGVDPLQLPSRKSARSELSLADDSIVVAWVARVTEVKGPERALELARKFPDVSFVLAGGGNLLPHISDSAPPNVRVVGWYSAATIYAAADIALSTSYNEGMPVSLIEAQLAGLPVVGNDVGSVREVIADGETGFVGTPSQSEALLGVLLRDPELRKKMASRAKSRAMRMFAPSRMVSAHASLYASLFAS